MDDDVIKVSVTMGEIKSLTIVNKENGGERNFISEVIVDGIPRTLEVKILGDDTFKTCEYFPCNMCQ